MERCTLEKTEPASRLTSALRIPVCARVEKSARREENSGEAQSTQRLGDRRVGSGVPAGRYSSRTISSLVSGSFLRGTKASGPCSST